MAEIEGYQEVLTRLQALAGDQTKVILRRALDGAGQVVLRRAQVLSPVRTGTMGANLKLRKASSRRGFIKFEVGADKKDYTGKAFYTAFVLYGHRMGKRKLGDARKEVKGHDFIKQAYEETKEQAVSAAVELIEYQLDKLAETGKL